MTNRSELEALMRKNLPPTHHAFAKAFPVHVPCSADAVLIGECSTGGQGVLSSSPAPREFWRKAGGINWADGGVGVWGEAPTGIGFYTPNNVRQDRAASGWVKAMTFIQGYSAPYTITKCFNSALTGVAASTPPCGMDLEEVQAGWFTVDVGFEVDDRFVSTTQECCFSYGIAPLYISPSGSKLTIFTWNGSTTVPFSRSCIHLLSSRRSDWQNHHRRRSCSIENTLSPFWYWR